MQAFTNARTAATDDEIWLLEHEPVFTLGLGGKSEHILDAGSIPVIRSDRGGQVTYHGPGQLIAYLLLDLRRLGLSAKELVNRAEQSVIDALAEAGVAARRREGAPGVYVGEAKIAALGFRIRRGCCFHGVAVNVDPDLEPFTRINPCGYAGMQATSLRALGIASSVAEFADCWLPEIICKLGVNVTMEPLPASEPRAAWIRKDLRP